MYKLQPKVDRSAAHPDIARRMRGGERDVSLWRFFGGAAESTSWWTRHNSRVWISSLGGGML